MKDVLTALDLSADELARKIGVSRKDILAEMREPNRCDLDYDPLWIAIRDYIDKRLAGVLAVRQEINAQLDRRQKVREAAWARMMK
jgi:DNA-binding XRE family transcriptional regulator